MNSLVSAVFPTREYKGCDIHAASFKSGARDWTPQACFWIDTENGPRRVWTASFAHCFGFQELAFRSKIEADNCAFRLARTLIDKTLPDLSSSAPQRSSSAYLAKIFAFARSGRFKRRTFKNY